jgi:hypothetical protein
LNQSRRKLFIDETLKRRSFTMPKKPTYVNSTRSSKPAAKAAPAATPARNTPVPRASAKREITHDMVAKRAFEIHASGKGGSPLDNWFRAERELKSGL